MLHALKAIIIALCLLPTSAKALDVSSEYIELRPLSPSTLHVELIGEIELGDTEKLMAEVAKYQDDPYLRYSFFFDSPGGNLIEGIRLGAYIASLGEMTSSFVGTWGDTQALCASACVYAFLGANYRYMGRIGVHRFYSSRDDLEGAHAMDVSQTISARIASYLRSRRVDPAFFDDIVSSSPNEMNWVSEERLIEVGVITRGVASKTVEYMNINGNLALSIEQVADVGRSSLILSCGDQGLVGISSLTQPELALIGRTEIVVGQESFAATEARVLSDDGYSLTSAFYVPPAAANAMAEQSNVGVRIVAPSGDIFFGFLGTVEDIKISETVLSCPTQVLQASEMERYLDYDIEGGDFENKGVRGISLDECEQICTALPQCWAVSYVVKKNWCWPKGAGGEVKYKAGVISSVKN